MVRILFPPAESQAKSLAPQRLRGKKRRAQHDASETIGGRRRERADVTRDHSRDMRPPEAEMIEHADKTRRR